MIAPAHSEKGREIFRRLPSKNGREIFRLRVCAVAAAFLAAAALGTDLVHGQPAQTPSASRPGEVVGGARMAPAGPRNQGDPAKGTGVIRGQITLSNGRPARKASIQLASNGPAHATAADENGNFEFTELPADTYYVSAGRPGYMVVEYGQKRAFERGEPIELADGETRTRVDIRLVPSGAVSGRIVDEYGDPIEGVTVRLLQVQFFSDRRQLVDVAQAGGRATDDTGAFRIYGVPPGDYVVRASVTERLPSGTTAFGSPVENAAADVPGYAPTYFPGTISPGDAQIVRVELSQEVRAIDFPLAPAATARVSGRATDARNQAVGVLLTRSLRSSGFGERPTRGISTGQGFMFDNVPPGEYVLQTTGTRRDQATEPDFAMTYITVDGRNITDVLLQGSAGSTVNGVVTFEGLAADAKTPPVQITAWPVDIERSPLSQNDIARARVGQDGRFSLGGLHGTRRLRLYQAPPGWQLKSIRADGIDVTDETLSFGLPRDSLSNVRIVLTSTGPVLSGRALDAQGRESHDYAVVAFSTNQERWYERSRFLASAAGRQDGSFTISSLAPGEYYVAAVSSLMNAEGWGEWQDPAFLHQLSAGATRVTLADGQTAAVTLRVIAR
jgi:hypothetical protein